ncbi:succinylglutamate desuccinylase/aspartoacylase family protein [Desulfobacula sp.]|uniref:succinylglutamate desuccinylase/aspartoacylase family protein n=1 Tax=Desulfobacula sp. TaxID=2593537 RepID=UPI0026079E92|nr:succinylglutamate desuccinylase/aspartoacylase family protein [Desulfobacula sp.]
MKKSLKIDNISINSGQKKAEWLEVAQDFSGAIKIPLLAINGMQSGRTFYVVSGLYGDEYNGMEAIYKIYEELNPQLLKGCFIGIPILNTPAFDLIKRNGPDELILNRTGSGNANGFLTEKITRYFMDHIVTKSDFGIEILEIGMCYKITPFVSLVKSSNGSYNLDYAKAFGNDLLWAGSASSSVLRNAVSKTGVDVFMKHGGGNGEVDQEHVTFEIDGIKNVLKHIMILEEKPKRFKSKYKIFDGFWMHGKNGGIFRSSLNLRQNVKKGEILATIHNLLNKEIEVIKSPYDGIVIGFRTVPRIRPGDWTVWVGRIQ